MKRGKYLLVTVLCAVLLAGCKSEATKNVENIISQIGEVTADSYDSIRDAKNAYNQLSEKEKAAVSNYKVLEKAEEDYDEAMAELVDLMIDGIGPVDIGSEEKIEEARTAYEELNEKQKKKVSNFGDLIYAEDSYRKILLADVAEALTELENVSPEEAEKINLAEDAYYALDRDGQIQVEKEVGDVEQKILRARQEVFRKAVDAINYEKGAPEAEQIQQMILALQCYNELGENVQEDDKDCKTLKKVLKRYRDYQTERTKKDKLYIRQNYLDACKPVSYENLMEYPTSYRKQKVKLQIKVIETDKEERLISGCMTAEDDLEHILCIRDQRPIKEPRIQEGDSFELYGIFEGISKVKIPEKGSGILGTGLFAKTGEILELPVIEFEYTSTDNLGVLAAGDPNMELTETAEEIQLLQETLDQLIAETGWED